MQLPVREWLTVQEVAERYGYNARYVQQMCKAALLRKDEDAPFVVHHTGDVYLIYRPSFEQYVDKRGRKG